MANKLKREFDLIVLKTELLDSGQRVFDENFKDVKFTLEYKVDGEFESDQSWKTSTNELGLREVKMTGVTPSVHLPDTVLKDLSDWFDRNTKRDRPLWVHLVKPYGLLSLFPWERGLGDFLKVPILMLPDFIFPPPREATTVLDVVLCGSAPMNRDGESIFRAVSIAAKKILEGSPRATRLHIFIDQQFTDATKKQWDAAGRLNVDVFVYDNGIAAKYITDDLSSGIVDSIDSLRSPWLLWMREALRGRSVDVVHFCCHGHIGRNQGSLLFAQSPLERNAQYLAVPVGVMELQTFLTQVGAWSTVFTSVLDGNSESGLRALADAIAQSRPGPMMMQVMSHDSEGSALAKGYHFLFNTTPEPAPRSDALFIYCQPYLECTSSQEAFDTRSHPIVSNHPTGVLAVKVIDLLLKAPTILKAFKHIAPAIFERITPIVTEETIKHILPVIARNSVQIKQIMSSMNLNIDTPFDAYFKGENEVCNLVASTERFAEQIQLRYQKLARDELLPDDLLKNQADIAKRTIEQIRSAVSETLEDHEKASL